MAYRQVERERERQKREQYPRPRLTPSAPEVGSVGRVGRVGEGRLELILGLSSSCDHPSPERLLGRVTREERGERREEKG